MTEYQNPALTVDNIILRYYKRKMEVLLVERSQDPYRGKYALVGGFVGIDETVTAAVKRIVKKKTSIDVDGSHIEQLYTYSGIHRDPRFRAVSVANVVYLLPSKTDIPITLSETETRYVWATVTPEGLVVDGKQLEWLDYAFDHYQMVSDFMSRMQGRINYRPSFLLTMPDLNTLTEYRRAFAQFEERYGTMTQTGFNRKHHAFFVDSEETTTRRGKPTRLYHIDIDYI